MWGRTVAGHRVTGSSRGGGRTRRALPQPPAWLALPRPPPADVRASQLEDPPKSFLPQLRAGVGVNWVNDLFRLQFEQKTFSPGFF